MIRIFRRIRKSLLRKGKLLSYAKYALGEVVLVMIGILLALQVNEWNESRKNRTSEQKLYKEITEVLYADLAHCNEKMAFLDESVEGLKFFILNDKDSLLVNAGMDEINKQIFNVWSVSSSFMPNRAYYNKLMSANQLELIQNKELKTQIIKLYEHYYVRYNDLDLNIEKQSVFSMRKHFYKLIIDDYIRYKEFKLSEEEFIKYYDVMIREYREIYELGWLTYGAMNNCKNHIEYLLDEIEKHQD